MQFSRLAALLSEEVLPDGSRITRVPSEVFRALLVAALKQKGEFDENYYLADNQDVKEAIDSSVLSGATDHYYAAGYFENRPPKRILVDERFYIQENPDVAIAIKKGHVSTPQEHFEAAGFREGRLPFKGFSLF